MKSTRILWILVLMMCFNVSEPQKLLLFLLDGFRWDYLDIHTDSDNAGFKKIIQQGSRAEYLIPDFPSLSYPNYYSLMTGLHCESHGIVSNYMYDEIKDEKFLFGYNRDSYKSYWWNDGEPLWITAVKQGKRSYFFYWPGCNVTIRGLNPTHCYPYQGIPDVPTGTRNFLRGTEEALEVLKNNTADVAGVYLELTDAIAHTHGPESRETGMVVRWLDGEFNKLMSKLVELGLHDTVNVMIFSDHGMTDISQKRTIDISKVLTPGDYKVIMGLGPTVDIWPKAGKLREVYGKLKEISPHMKVVLKDEMPDKWHYRNHYRIAPITCLADLGWVIITPEEGFPKSESNRPYTGYHGYDNRKVQMRGVFFGAGPNFRRGYTAPAFQNVNLYQLMCEILRIHPSPHNGTWTVVKDMFITTPRHVYDWSQAVVVLPVMAVIAFCLWSFIVKKKHKAKRV